MGLLEGKGENIKGVKRDTRNEKKGCGNGGGGKKDITVTGRKSVRAVYKDSCSILGSIIITRQCTVQEYIL